MTLSLTDWVTHSQYFTNWHTKSDLIHLWPLRHLIRVIRGHDLTNKKTMTMTMTKTIHLENAFEERSLRLVALETFEQSDEGTWQLRTWINENLCYLKIKSDTGQHSQFLWCFDEIINLWRKKTSLQAGKPNQSFFGQEFWGPEFWGPDKKNGKDGWKWTFQCPQWVFGHI